MDRQQMTLSLIRILQEWDPFEVGSENYEPEIADAVLAVSNIEDVQSLARRLKEIYEFSFDEPLDFQACLAVAEKLIMIRTNTSCTL
ncbi:DUF1871 family protein [Peribacillus asahii]|uniref:DUF1871 family protein n=1 Tax=Peribacillus asahii TaxID=228899 RepID=UPI0038143830